MGTKQLRINDPEQIRSRVGIFLGKKINIVLQDNTAVFGELTGVNSTEIQLRNMRSREVKYSFSEIAEIYIDSNA